MNFPSDPKTVVHYRPLIDMKPAEPDTMLTGMCAAMEVTEQSGQEEMVITWNMQLFKGVGGSWVKILFCLHLIGSEN